MSSLDDDDDIPFPKPRRKLALKPSPEPADHELLSLLHGSDPLRLQLCRLENEAKDKDRELAEAQGEIKALKLSERAKEKAVEELSEELRKLDEKVKATELLLENKNLELKKINDEKKAALAAQFAAEATLRRVHAAQKDEDMPPIEAILLPLEAELRLARQELAKLQDDNRALDRLTKSKEAALLEAERTVRLAEAKVSMVDYLQNRNQELLKQIEICQEENKILDKMYRQKVAEVEKMSVTVADLEEAVLAGGAAANAVRDYKRRTHGLLEEKRTLERELARTKVSANRAAVVAANEWKDSNDKVMPVRQWLEERRSMQGEMQQLRDKVALAERTAKTEAQLKEKLQLRLKVLEEGVKASANGGTQRPVSGAGEESVRSGANSSSVSKSRGSVSSKLLLKNAKGTSKSFDGGRPSERISSRGRASSYGVEEQHKKSLTTPRSVDTQDTMKENMGIEAETARGSDSVSGLLYDMLQKEVIALRKARNEKDQSLKDKDDAIEMLAKKVDTLTKAMGVEAKKMRREVAAMEKEVSAMRVDKEQDSRGKRLGNTKGTVSSSQRRNS